MLGRGLLAAVVVGWFVVGVAVADDLVGVTSENIYQRLKDCDEQGMTVRRFSNEMSVGAISDILLDEQGEASGGRGNDAAPRGLFRYLNDSKLTTGIYPDFIALLDNYAIRSGEEETTTKAERAEIDAFLDKVMGSRPMKVAFHYVSNNLSVSLSREDFRKKLMEIWFETYTNHYGGRATEGCSGFEHVFVGEGQYPDNGTATKGEVTGYHSWIQFARHEKKGFVNYLGHKYDLPAERLPANPCVITLRMIWDVDPDGTGPHPSVQLYKEKGGVFVGMSPECELAMGTVAFFELQKGLLSNDRRRTTIDGSTFDLVLHASVKSNGQRGPHVRTFYPVLLGYAQPSDVSPVVSREGPVVITKGLPNPEGDDETGEWVEIKNISDQPVDLERWTLRDKQDGKKELSGAIKVGETLRIDLSRATGSKLLLGNSGDRIRLLNAGEDLVDEVSYQNAKSGEVVEFLQ
ncbi:lamin tail domain-containing protein [Lacunimicrobium album]